MERIAINGHLTKGELFSAFPSVLISRRSGIMRPLIAALSVAFTISQVAVSGAVEPSTVLQADSVRALNNRAAVDSVGKGQAPLTQEEVIAAVRWSLLERNKLPVSDKTFQMLTSIPDNHELAAGFELEFVSCFQPNDTMEFTAWSVRLRIPAEPQGSTCIMIREKMISSRLIGNEERKVIHKWQENGVLSSFESFEMHRYAQERARAAEIDAAE
jgi:hypothetical protein